MLIDTHCHFDFPPFIDDVASSVKRFKQAGIDSIIVPAVSQARFNNVLALANQQQPIYCALGLHPIYHHKNDDLDLLAAQLDQHNNKIVAIGEVGLDSYIVNTDLERQIYLLSAQLGFAKEYHLPVILHSRKTHPVLYRLLKQVKLPDSGVIHGFSGSYEEALQFIRLGYSIGVGGVISYPRANKTRNAISRIPLSSIVLETDAPDMPLCGLQGQPNRPENITKIFEILTTLRIEPPSQILNTILTNTLTLFCRINTMKIT
ncbi:metal-dependent hydrolase [Orbus sasakiae]|uniref:Metal-dependent hydrolase n=1 Tax=Orbus sasakiae TaxID=1078475 RepID=A0ABP9N9I3_9GAMM